MNELRRIFCDQLRPAVCIAALGGLVHFQVAAQVADPAFERFRSQVVGNSVAYSYGGNGTPLAGAGNATGIGVATKHGPINGTLTQKISSSAMGKAFGRVAFTIGGPVGLAFLALPAIIEWMDDANVVHEDGEFKKPDPLFCSSNCYNYTIQSQDTAQYQTFPHATTACNWAKPADQDFGSYVYTYTVTSITTSRCNIRRSDNVTTFINFTRVSRTPDVGDGLTTATPLEVETAMSAINTSPEALAELYKLGETMNLANPIPDLVDTLRAEFEARSPESVTTEETTSPTEDKTAETTCATYTQVVGNVLSLVENCETVTTTQAKDPVTGDPVGAPTTTTTTSGTNQPDPQTKPEEQAEGLCQLFPNIAACAELGTATETIPTSSQSVSYTPESVFGAGTCPADKTFVAYGQTLQLTNMAQACDLLDTYVKPIAILLAAFAALMIVAVGVPE